MSSHKKAGHFEIPRLWNSDWVTRRQFGRRATNAEERVWDRAEYVRTLQPASLDLRPEAFGIEESLQGYVGSNDSPATSTCSFPSRSTLD